MTLDLTSLRKAVAVLKTAVETATSNEKMRGLDSTQKDLIRAGVIQNFELTYELCWKFMKRWLDHNLGNAYVDGLTRRELFRRAAEHQIINDVDQWMIYHEARNQTVHTYDEDSAQEVFETAVKFSNDAQSLLQTLESKNA